MAGPLGLGCATDAHLLGRLVALRQGVATDHEQRSEDQEAYVPHLRVRGGFADVVQPEYVVVDDAFHQIEPAPSHQHAAEQTASRPSTTSTDRPVEQEE